MLWRMYTPPLSSITLICNYFKQKLTRSDLNMVQRKKDGQFSHIVLPKWLVHLAYHSLVTQPKGYAQQVMT